MSNGIVSVPNLEVYLIVLFLDVLFVAIVTVAKCALLARIVQYEMGSGYRASLTSSIALKSACLSASVSRLR